MTKDNFTERKYYMFEKIIDFFKKLFGKEEVSVDEISYVSDNDIVEEENIVKTKILLNNDIKGYDIKNLSIKANDTIIENIEIPNQDSRVVVLSSNEQPKVLELVCDVVAVENGETFAQLKATHLVISQAQFQTVNITDTLLNLKKITFGANVAEEENSQVEIYDR